MSTSAVKQLRNPVAPHWTIAQARAHFRLALAEAGIEMPDVDTRHLLCAGLGIDPVKLVTAPDALVGDRAPQLNAWLDRRLAREPVSRILGWREFYGRRFEISPATLDPRPDTETLVDAAIAAVKACGLPAPRILDIGTGSGCLLVTLLAELPNATGVGTDISSDALAVATRNAEAHGVAGRTEWRAQDCLAEDLDLGFDILVTNPPYVRSDDLGGLQPEVALFDPLSALDGGSDGLVFYRRIVAALANSERLRCAIFEVGYDQAAEVARLLRLAGQRAEWPEPLVINDLGQVGRCVVQKTRLPC